MGYPYCKLGIKLKYKCTKYVQSNYIKSYKYFNRSQK
jgi:hypothetical protein